MTQDSSFAEEVTRASLISQVHGNKKLTLKEKAEQIRDIVERHGPNPNSPVSFAHLHLHTPWSLLDGFCRIDDLILLAIEYGMTSVGVSEHGNCHSHVEFYQKCKEVGIKPVLGCEVYITPNRFWKKENFDQGKGFWMEKKKREVISGWRPNMAHLLLIAKNDEGYKNLLQMTSKAYLEGFYFKPRVDYDLIKQYGKGLIATTACFPEGTLVQTQNGLKPIQLIESGEKVKTHNNNWKDVIIPTTRVYEGDLVSVKTKGSTFEITSTDNHKYLTIPHRTSKTCNISDLNINEKYFNELLSLHGGGVAEKSRKAMMKRNAEKIEPAWKEAKDLSVYDSLLTPIDSFMEDIPKLDISYAYMENAKYHIPESIQVSPELLEILGLYAAEGSLKTTTMGSIHFSLDSRKTHLIDKVVSFFDTTFGLKTGVYKKKDSLAVSLDINSIEIYKLFSNWFESGAKNKNMPTFIRYLKPELQIHFVKGLFLGDGYFRFREGDKNGAAVSFSTISKQLASDVVHVFHRMLLNPCVTTYPEKTDKEGVHHQEWYSTEFAGNIANSLYDFIWEDKPLLIEMNDRRTKDIPFLYNEVYYMKHNIVSLKSEEWSGQVYCLNVEGDHSFIAEGAIVHNCLGGEIPQLILRGRYRVAKNLLKFYQKCFDELYLEVQPSTMPEQIIVNNTLIQWSKELNIPLVGTSDAHMLRKEEKSIHAALTVIGKSEDSSDISVYEHCYFMSAQEMLDFKIPEEALRNAHDIAERCNVELEMGVTKYPKFNAPGGYDFDTYLAKLTNEALFDMALKKSIDIAEYQKRLQYELSVVRDKKISAYFLIVWDFVKYAKDNGILTGPGRGSAAGSLISYLLKITNIDPIKYHLLFARFINPERMSFPDIDMDFSYLRRHEVIEYLNQKYGVENVAQIGTFGTLSAKAALKDIGRGLGIDHNLINEMNKLIPVSQGKVLPIKESLEAVPQLREWEKQYPELFELAQKVESLPRTSSVHACGVLISDEPIAHSIPVSRSKDGGMVTQYEGPVLEKIGYIKFDILGLKNLSVIDIARQLVEENHNKVIDVDELEPTDPKVYDLIQSGNTLGIFQLESEGMSKVFQGLHKVDFESLIAGVSLYRPGPMLFIPQYQARANGSEQVSYVHPDFEEVLGNTFGVLVYQEQLMKLSQVFGGFTEGESDSLRKATGKKSKEVMDKVLPDLHSRIMNSGYAKSIADSIIKLVEPWVGYGLTEYNEAC